MTSESLTKSRPPQAARFRRLAAIGHGGMADVFLASARGVGGALKLLVLKQLRPAHARDPEYRAMFQREARIAALLSHPNVVQTYEVGSEDGSPFIAMEYLEGQPLHRVLRRLHRPAPEPRGLPLAMHLRVLAELLAGLHYVHELRDLDGAPLGLVHRDVSPHNVLVTYDGQIKLVDFGIARAHAGDDTGVGTFKGKISYASPEQVRGRAIDRRSDLFAVGVMLWEALTRQRMWAGLEELAIARRLEAGEVPPLPAGLRAAPALRALCESALAVDPERRPATAEALRDALEACLADMDPAAPRAIGALIGAAFADDRAALRDAVERQIRIARFEEPPLLDLSEATGLTTSSDSLDGAHPDEPTRPDGLADATADPAAGAAVPRETTWSGPLVREPGPAARRWPTWLAGAAVVAAGAWMAFRAGPQVPVPQDLSSGAYGCGAPDRPVVELSGDIEHAATLTCDKIYRLRAATVVRPGASLTIEPGTTLVGDRATRGALIVQPGAKLVADGTRERPIVFTSERPPGRRAPGDWGGVIVLGRAPTGLRDADGRPTTGRVEGLASGGEYGGADPEDSSGVLRYVRVEYAGTELGPNNETNGLTLAGVGRGTVVDHVQVRRPADDCFEFFGGTVDAKHLICQDPGDDGFDWDLGWSGRLQFFLLRDGADARDTAAGLEGDERPLAAAPAIFNATLCGRGRALAREHYGVLLRRGTRATLGSSVVVGFAAPLDVRDPDTTVDLRPGLWLAHNFAAALAHPESPAGAGALADDDGGLDEAALLTAAGARLADPDLPGCVDPAGPGPYKPAAPLPAPAPPADGFFDPTAAFAGAFRDAGDAWDAGWAVWTDT